jgi:transcriptional regulator with GAF, ATPase, and Fis domain
LRLLRVLSEMEIERVGGTRPIRVDVRIIAATNRNLVELIKQGKFREDLWFRLNVFPIVVPPLRQRKSDIPALTHYFLRKKMQELNFEEMPVLAQGTIEKLQNYHWPGNVRELENLVERTIILGMTGSPGKPLDFDPFLPQPADNLPQSIPADSNKPIQLDDFVRRHIAEVLKMTGGRVQGKKGAAALLGIHPSTLRNKMKKLHIPYGRKAVHSGRCQGD